MNWDEFMKKLQSIECRTNMEDVLKSLTDVERDIIATTFYGMNELEGRTFREINN